MKKPAIPPTPKAGEDRARFDQAVKEALEVVLGRRGGAITPLNAETATSSEVAAKINEILGIIQG